MKRLLCVGMLLWCTTLQAQDLSKVLAQVPESANVLTVIDTRSLLQTPKANKEGWKERRNLDYLAGKVAFPPNASFVVVASDYNFAERRNDWQIGLFDFPSKIYEDRIAQREGSNVELIENLYVIPSRRNMYFVQFERERYATYSPANRQKLTNWIRFAKSNKESKVNPYLADAVIRGGQDGQINVAVDLQQTLDRVEVMKRLQASKTVTDAGVDRTKLSNLIMSIQGIRFSIRVTDLSLAQLHVDFQENIGEFDKVLPGLLAETLESNGFHGTDVAQWQTSTRGKTFTARGPLDDDEAKRIMFMVLPSTVEPAVTSGLTGEAAIATTSQAYFRAVTSLLNELRTRSDRLDRGQAWVTNASWYEYTAKKINSLPVVDTDEKLLEYSAEVTQQLMLAAESLRGVNIEGRVLDSYKRGGTNWGVGAAGWGWGGVGGWGAFNAGYASNVQDVESAKAENAAKGAKDRNAIWVNISKQTTEIREEMAKKYRIEF